MTTTQCTIRPTHDRVAVEEMEEENKTVGGILLPDSSKKKSQRAKVVAVGPGARNEKGELTPMSVKVGDIVLVEKYAGTAVELEGEKLLVLREKEIMAICEN